MIFMDLDVMFQNFLKHFLSNNDFRLKVKNDTESISNYLY